ncbi:arylsulfatase [Gloeocapsa sp. PCC 73106]|uniref:arylsulfatase B n=1 Tax=Gloeocapsa sp. PCC 73106 TaxID=102232 RepID=UPI0002ABE838|nr:arylsulfatase [Gloeocapsa sp. PCC 73106]ELR98092.1 arylsulfatase A family protein [Gloeocapsa sp. PCC 73106]
MKLKFLRIVIFICLTLTITYYFRGANNLKAEINKPNIIVILADDLGWNDVGFHGSEIKTTNLDKLAVSGVRLERFYVKAMCTPTRAAFLTGRHPFRYGMSAINVTPWSETGLPLEEKTIAETLKEAGYYTAILGKWHLGHYQESYLPTSRGFDYHYGHYLAGIDYFTHKSGDGLDWHRNNNPVYIEGYSTDLIAQDAVQLINNHDYHKNPLFLYIAFNAPHIPLQAKAEDLEDYLTIEDEQRRLFAAQVQSMDEAIGSIIQSLQAKQVWNNTLLVFTSDNGGEIVANDIRFTGRGDNRPLRGGKRNLYEGGVRVPTIISYPGHLSSGKTVEQMFSIVDLYPTFAKLAGLKINQEQQIDGVDILESIAEKNTNRDELLIQYRDTSAAIIKGDYKLIKNGFDPFPIPYYDSWELFNIKDDPLETHNLVHSEPDKVAAIEKILEQYEGKVKPAIAQSKPADFVVPKIWSPEYLQNNQRY